MAKPLLNIEFGIKIGRLEIGELVRFVQDHPLFVETKPSYLHQGRLRECLCSCGQVRLIAERALATGRVQSCGCLRAEIRAKSASQKVHKQELIAEQKNCKQLIKVEQLRLRAEKIKQVPIRDEQELQRIATRLRSLIAKQGMLTRQIKGS